MASSKSATLFQEAKSCVFVLKIFGCSENNTLMTYASGFSIGVDGFLLTCGHTFYKLSSVVIGVRSLDEDRFSHEAELVHLMPSWDLALLKVNNIESCGSIALAPDGSLREGETLYHIGHPHSFVGSCLIGNAAYSCSESAIIPKDSRTCEEFVCDPLSSTSEYRIMGHVFNRDVFAKPGRQVDEYEKELHPLVPIIQFSGLCCEDGCSGGPVFNDRKQIVGLLIGRVDGFEIAVHVTLLRFFVQDYLQQQSIGASTLLKSKDVPRKKKI